MKEPEKIVGNRAYRRDRETVGKLDKKLNTRERVHIFNVAGAKVPKQTGPAVVRGLGRISTKDLKEAREGEKHREAKAFLAGRTEE